MKKKKRSKFEIIAEILEVCKRGALKTRVVYGTDLNFQLASKYLARLKSSGLIEERGDLFYTTDRGKRFLHHLGGPLDMTRNLSTRF